MNVLPHVVPNKAEAQPAVHAKIADSEGYAICQQNRMRIEHGSAWAQTTGYMRQVLVSGIKKVEQKFVLTMEGNNLTTAQPPPAGTEMMKKGREIGLGTAKDSSMRRCISRYGNLAQGMHEGQLWSPWRGSISAAS